MSLVYESERRSSAFENITPSLVIHYSWSVEFKCKLALGLVSASSFPPPLHSIGFWPSSRSSRGVSNRFDRCRRLFPHLVSSLFIGLTVRDTICALRYYLYDHCWHQAKPTNFFKQFEMSRAVRHDKWDDPRDVFVDGTEIRTLRAMAQVLSSLEIHAD